MDDISKANRTRWNDLARANVEFSRPFMDFSVEQAEKFVHRYGVLKDVAGKQVLCLASGGGQDSLEYPAFRLCESPDIPVDRNIQF